MFYSLGKNSEKPYTGKGEGGGGGLYVQGLNDPRKKPALIIVGKSASPKEN